MTPAEVAADQKQEGKQGAGVLQESTIDFPAALSHRPSLRPGKATRALGGQAYPRPESFDSLVPVREYGDLPPIFFFHTHGGTASYCRRFLQHLGPNQPVYGLHSQALAGKPAHTSIEEMASHYADEMTRAHKGGPYHLFGYCSAGFIAFEVAKQLELRGESVALLAMFNTPTANYCGARWYSLFTILFQRGRLELLRLRSGRTRKRLVPWLQRKAQNFKERLSPAPPSALLAKFPLQANSNALKSYRPTGRLLAPMIFFSTPELNYFYAAPPVETWRPFTQSGIDNLELPEFTEDGLADVHIQAVASHLRERMAAERSLGSIGEATARNPVPTNYVSRISTSSLLAV